MRAVADDKAAKEKTLKAGIDLTKGIAISPDKIQRIFVIEPYLKDFILALRRLSNEMDNEGWDLGFLH